MKLETLLKKVTLSSAVVLCLAGTATISHADNTTPQSILDDSQLKPSKDRDDQLRLPPRVRATLTASQAQAWMDTMKGQAIDYDGSYGAQCVDLVRKYSAEFLRYDIGTCSITGGAKDYASQAVPNGYTRINYSSGFVAKTGDIVIWNGGGGGYGHVAIVYSVSGTSMVVLEQNPGAAKLTTVTNYNKPSNGQVTAVLRPNSLVANLVAPKIISTSIEGTPNAGKFNVRVKTSGDVTSVKVPIWSDANGQDDLKWYVASKVKDGEYLATFDGANHKNQSGSYHVQAYAYNGDKQAAVAVNNNLQVYEAPKIISTAIEGNPSAGEFKVRVKTNAV
ncbi:GBS Bsp-like repeat-containing protein, partial [Lactococcus hodotermopsidis]|uniref:GBS Bsp-like repeat-containing protein n=1 Tax=Pseudolactococcus hodotermopsidis TaxID=2709157 RepID=UPI001555682F